MLLNDVSLPPHAILASPLAGRRLSKCHDYFSVIPACPEIACTLYSAELWTRFGLEALPNETMFICLKYDNEMRGVKVRGYKIYQESRRIREESM